MNKFINCICFCLLAVALAGCQGEDESVLSSDAGFLISLADDAEITTRSLPSELARPVVEKFKLKISNQSTGNILYNGNYTEQKIAASEGTYDLSASYGTDLLLSLDSPYYLGETTGTIVTDETTSVNIICQVANALTSVVFVNGEAGFNFEEDFESYAVRVAIQEDDNNSSSVNLTNDGKSAYYRANSMPAYTFVGILKNGTEFTQVLSDGKFSDAATFAAGTHCKITLTMGKVAAGVKVEVEKVEVETVSIHETIPLEWLPKPKIESVGFTGNSLSVVETETVADASLHLQTATPLQDLKLRFNFADERFTSLNPLNGKEYYLLSDPADRSKVEEVLNVTLPNIGSTGAAIDLSPLANKLLTDRGATVSNTIELDVRANNRWSSDDASANRVYTLTCVKPEFGVNVYPGNIWTKEFTMNALAEEQVRSGDFAKLSADMSYQYSVDGQSWESLGNDLRKTSLQPNTKYRIRGVYRDAVPGDVAEFTTYDSFQIPNSTFDEGYTSTNPKKNNPLYVFKGGWIDTRNALTCHSSGANAFYVSKSSTVPRSDSNRTVAHLATIGWGAGSSCAFGNKTGSVIKNISAGIISVGSYVVSTNKISAKQAYIRPTAMNFTYKATPYENDEYLIQIELLNITDGIETVVGEGKLQSNVTKDSYISESLDISYNEEHKELFISHIRILFQCGTKEDRDHLANSFSTEGSGSFYSNYYLKGSEFWLDEFSLVYNK